MKFYSPGLVTRGDLPPDGKVSILHSPRGERCASRRDHQRRKKRGNQVRQISVAAKGSRSEGGAVEYRRLMVYGGCRQCSRRCRRIWRAVGGGGCITWLLGYRRDPSCEGSAARGVSPCNASERSCRRFEARVSLLVGGGKDLEKREISERERESITNPGNPKLRRRAGESRMFIRH